MKMSSKFDESKIVFFCLFGHEITILTKSNHLTYNMRVYNIVLYFMPGVTQKNIDLLHMVLAPNK